MKNIHKKIVCLISILLIVGVVATACATKPEFPTKEITFICPWPPGGSADLITRTISEIANREFETPFVVVNRAGANGIIATTELATTEADGYTISFGAIGLFTTSPFIHEVTYTMEDFDFLIGLTNMPIVISVPAASPHQTLDDLIKAAKENNLTIRYANSGMGGIPQLTLAYLFQLAGVQSQPIPFEGSAPAITAALGGHVDAVASHPAEVAPHAKAGKLRPLAISSPQRSPAIPDVPTMKEKGLDIDTGVRHFVFAPTGIPEDIKETLVNVLTETTNHPDFIKAMDDAGIMIDVMTGQQFEKFVKEQIPIMKTLIESMPKVQ